MNVKEAAAKFNVSRTSIYNTLNRLESKGRQGKDGTITAEGLRLLESVYSNLNQVDSTLEENLNQQVNEQKQQIEELKKQLNDAEAALKLSEAREDELRKALQETERRAKAAENRANDERQANEILAVKVAAAEQRISDLQNQIVIYESRVVPLLPPPASERKPLPMKKRIAILFSGEV